MQKNNELIVVDLGINTHHEAVVYMREDCHLCRAEGFYVGTRVLLAYKNKELIATVNTVADSFLAINQVGFSLLAMQALAVSKGDVVTIKHAPILTSLASVRKKIYGGELGDNEFLSIINDITAHRYSDIEMASFLAVSAGKRLTLNEIIALTRAMVACGKRIDWDTTEPIFDKHCIGGLPGNRTTPIVVAIVSAAGLHIPKTSSRAITSPAGTADTMETLTRVNLSLLDIQAVVKQTGACLVWGGAAELSPADDMLIRIERALDIDGEGQLIASVLSKKIAAGSTHILIDIPVGDTAKVRSYEDAQRLEFLFIQVGKALELTIRVVMSDGSKPIGRGIGPVAEAIDVLSVLNNEKDAPIDLRDRAIELAAQLLDMSNNKGININRDRAVELLLNGHAGQQFTRILEAQGGIKILPTPLYHDIFYAEQSGILVSIDNRRLAKLAKLAGAPAEPTAGLQLIATVGQIIKKGDALCTLLSNTRGERLYALAYYEENKNLFALQD